MAPALTSSNPFHLQTAATDFLRRSTALPKGLAVPTKPAKPIYAAAAKKQDEDLPTKPKGFSFDFNAAKSFVPALLNSSASKGALLFANRRRKDPNTVYVAGATGQIGVRIVQILLKQGFIVRAGVPDLTAAQDLARLATNYKMISPEEAKRLNAVESSFEDAETIAKAIGNASKVAVSIGPEENGTGPSSEVTTNAALQVVKAAEIAGVGHITVIYDASKPGFSGSSSSTYNVLDGITSFFSNLFSNSQTLTPSEFLSKLVETTDASYTVIKSMLIDDIYAEKSLGINISNEGTDSATATTDYSVSKSQIASLVADIFTNTSMAENKVVQVSATSSPSSTPIEQVFSSIPEDGRRKAYKENLEKTKAKEAEEEEAQMMKAAKLAKEEAQKLSESVREEIDNEVEQISGASSGGIFRKVELPSWEKLSSQFQVVKKIVDDEPKVQVATVRGEAKARRLAPQKAAASARKAAASVEPKRRQRAVPTPQKKGKETETRKVFGGMFQQQTIYMDD